MIDLMAVAAQAEAATRTLTERQARTAAALEAAEPLARCTPQTWRDALPRLRATRRAFLLAHSALPPADAFPAPPAPPAYVVVATDGSQIAPDRHEGFAGCYLLHISRIRIAYGADERPRLEAEVHIEVDDEDPDEEERRAARALPLQRFAREMRALGRLAAEAAGGPEAIALTDGSLIAWPLGDDPENDPARTEALAALREMLETARTAQVPPVGYVSGPGSREVVNALRVLACGAAPGDCPPDCLCRTLRFATDAALFARLLAPGERSPLFTSQGQAGSFSHVLSLYGDAHWIAFFYLNVGAEIARIEVPAWVAAAPALVERVHALCLDQARKGRGYPVALAEAHERAVVRAADRQAFLNLLTRTLVARGAPAAGTRKALAKRTRAV